MQLSVALVAWIVVAAVALIFIVSFWQRGRRTRSPRSSLSRGPSSLRYVCRGCSNQFTHTRRTVGAYEKGARSFFCNSCHAKWRETNATKPAAPQIDSRTEPASRNSTPDRRDSRSPVPSNFNPVTAPTSSRANGGCLGAVILMLVVPIAIITIAAKYA